MIMKFAIGEVPDEHIKAVQEEERQHGSFLRIPIEQVLGPCWQCSHRYAEPHPCHAGGPGLTQTFMYRVLWLELS